MRKFTKEFVTSLITIILAIIAIALFISSGSTLLFYVAVAIALAFGFYNAWMISLLEGEPETPIRKGSRGR